MTLKPLLGMAPKVLGESARQLSRADAAGRSAPLTAGLRLLYAQLVTLLTRCLAPRRTDAAHGSWHPSEQRSAGGRSLAWLSKSDGVENR